METTENPQAVQDILLTQPVDVDELYAGVRLPTLVVRIKALFIDFCLILLIFTAASYMIKYVSNLPDLIKGAILVFTLYLYDPLFVAFFGGTLGQKAMNLKVVRYRDPERRIALGWAVIRFAVKLGLGLISFVTVTSARHKRAIHDSFSGSVVLFSR